MRSELNMVKYNTIYYDTMQWSGASKIKNHTRYITNFFQTWTENKKWIHRKE